MRAFIGAALLCVAGAAHADWTDYLQGRDLTGDGVVDAYFSPEQNITWLKDTQYALHSGYVPLSDTYFGGGKYAFKDYGLLDVNDAPRFASMLVVGETGGWRLSTGTYSYFDIDPGVTVPCNFQNCNLATSEVQTLWSLIGGDPTPFDGLTQYYGTYVRPPDSTSYTIRVGFDGKPAVIGSEGAHPIGAWAVHDGDVGVAAPIPEPSTYALMIAGLAAVGFLARHRRPASPA